MLHAAWRLAFSGIFGVGLVVTSSFFASADVLMIQGSTTFNSRVIVPYQAVIENAAGHKLTVVPNKSSVGLLALFEGRADLAMISTALEDEIAVLRKTNPQLPFERLHNFKISETRAAFAVHSSNTVRSTDGATMRRILLGDIGNWSALGGADLPLKVVMVRDGGGVQTSVQSAILAGQQVKPHDLVSVGIGEEVVKIVGQEPGALGLTQLGIVQKSGLPELATDVTVKQQLNLVCLDAPTPIKRAVIDATISVARIHLK